MLQAKAQRAAAVASGDMPADPALERWDDGFIHNFASQIEVMSTVLQVISIAKLQNMAGRDAYVAYLQIVTACLDFTFAYSTRVGGAMLVRCDWVEASLGKLQAEGAAEGAGSGREADTVLSSMVCMDRLGDVIELNMGRLVPAVAAA